ncbi:MAG: DEAD/DEAH box helicase [Candidatus Altiarchaeota archaeon]|nr:DEAD/DEAH box helicase [Candidatus Altiarchaeota archaeon]
MFVSHPLVRENLLSLRRYQETVIAKAVEENTLVVLPTGLGKTVIAAMVAAIRLQAHPGSKVLFLAPTKPLAVQHQKTFMKMLKVEETAVLTGETPVKEREKLWNDSRIIFATPQTVENDLTRDFKIENVSLAIFDEAHRAVGDYSYVYIAKEYVKKSRYPLVLGLTASPSSEKEKVVEICRNLSIRNVEAKTEHDRDVRPYVQEVKVRWVKVDLPSDFDEVKGLIEGVLRDQLKALKEAGYLESADLRKVNKTMLLETQGEIRKEITSGMDSFQHASTVASALKVDHAIELLETHGISAVSEYLKRLSSQRTKAGRKLLSDGRMMKAKVILETLRAKGIEHPKLEKLVEVMKQHKNEKVLIFTQYRDSVDSIIHKLNENDILAHKFIGQSSRGLEKGMTQKKQVEVLDKFRDGNYNALIATSVAEEGLDIPKVDVVVFYEPVPSEIRTIQRRGRTGRSDAGVVYVLMTKGTRDEGYYWASLHKERRMEGIVRELQSGLKEQKSIIGYDMPKKGGEEAELEGPGIGYGQQSIIQYNMEKQDGIKVIVDARERNPRIIDVLKEKGVKVEVRQLPVGDYLLSDRVCAERKTMADFLQSIIDKRLMSQLADMRRNFMTPILILEGSGAYNQRGIHPNAVRGVLAAIAVDFNVPIIPTEDDIDTAHMLYTIAKREQEDEERIVALRGEKKPWILSERQRFVVESLPNVSAVLADRLLEKFESVEKVMAAGEKELMEVEGIGEKKAEEIRKVVKSRYTK